MYSRGNCDWPGGRRGSITRGLDSQSGGNTPAAKPGCWRGGRGRQRGRRYEPQRAYPRLSGGAGAGAAQGGIPIAPRRCTEALITDCTMASLRAAHSNCGGGALCAARRAAAHRASRRREPTQARRRVELVVVAAEVGHPRAALAAGRRRHRPRAG